MLEQLWVSCQLALDVDLRSYQSLDRIKFLRDFCPPLPFLEEQVNLRVAEAYGANASD